MNLSTLKGVLPYIKDIMDENRDYLIELDSKNGDGDLGISMSSGYKALAEYIKTEDENDLGKVFMTMSSIFNEAAPSSLGTITSFIMIGMAKYLKGKKEAELKDISLAMEAGINLVMQKANSKIGDKTILDSLYPAIKSLEENSDKDKKEAFKIAFDAASIGSDNTKNMIAVHGRAAYYGDKTLGMLDGGSVVGKLIFESIDRYLSR